MSAPTPSAPTTGSRLSSGFGRLLVAAYGVLALAATGRSVMQLVAYFERGPAAGDALEPELANAGTALVAEHDAGPDDRAISDGTRRDTGFGECFHLVRPDADDDRAVIARRADHDVVEATLVDLVDEASDPRREADLPVLGRGALTCEEHADALPCLESHLILACFRCGSPGASAPGGRGQALGSTAVTKCTSTHHGP